jgi:glycosyltransferase involved in cell wall biosynthesis
VKLALVAQRYGAEINGGAELHARYIAERLATRHEVEVLTTCARDYVTWADAYPAGETEVNGVPVFRYSVSEPRDPAAFGRRSAGVFDATHSIADELTWLRSEGPTSPALIDAVARRSSAYDFLVFFSYRYYHAYHGIRRAADRAVLVPTAERDEAMGLAIFPPIFRGVRAVMYNSPEEQALIRAASGNDDVPGVVVGVSSRMPARAEPDRFRQKYGLHGPFILYIGRIDANKGCDELFRFFRAFPAAQSGRLQLVLIGSSVLPVPDHPSIHHLGFVSDGDKFDALAASEALVMPSFYESLSMVAIEAWALGRPVLANARCDVLQGQCLRSNGGLFYSNAAEFAEALFVLTGSRVLNRTLGLNGREYFQRHYTWPVIDRKYDDMLALLCDDNAAGRTRPAIESLPGWFTQRRRIVPPARERLASLPSGPVYRGSNGRS